MTHGLEERDVNRTHRSRLTLALGAALIAGASLSGIAAAQDTELPTVPETPVPLEFLYSPFTDYAPFFVAEDKGYFDEHGLDVTLTIKSGSAETTQLLAARPVAGRRRHVGLRVLQHHRPGRDRRGHRAAGARSRRTPPRSRRCRSSCPRRASTPAS